MGAHPKAKDHGSSMAGQGRASQQKRTPVVMMFGTRHMISGESARDWRRAREEEAKSDAALLEHERRVAHGKIIGAKAAASPHHVSKSGARAERRRRAKGK
jgi:hypothetical protein